MEIRRNARWCNIKEPEIHQQRGLKLAACNTLERAARRLAWTGKVSLQGGLWLGELAIWENNGTENGVLRETSGPRAATDGCCHNGLLRFLWPLCHPCVRGQSCHTHEAQNCHCSLTNVCDITVFPRQHATEVPKCWRQWSGNFPITYFYLSKDLAVSS